MEIQMLKFPKWFFFVANKGLRTNWDYEGSRQVTLASLVVQNKNKTELEQQSGLLSMWGLLQSP